MQHTFIMTIVGDDQPDIVNALAQKTRSLGGEWIKTKVMRLDGQFAAVMKVAVEETQEANLKKTLERDFPDLSFFHAPVRQAQQENTEVLDLVLDCDDRPGLTKELTRVLYELNLRPENLEVSRLPVLEMGKTVYSAKMRVGVPASLSKEALGEALSEVCASCRISFE